MLRMQPFPALTLVFRQNLSSRERLKEECVDTLPVVEEKLVSKIDGTVKYLFRLHDGECVESVFMRYEHGNTICISSQVGCRMGCAFCASGSRGVVRSLTILRTLLIAS